MLPTPPTARTGRLGEEAASRHIIALGYRIVARNWRSGRYEIDIIAIHRGTLHFVEVKTRRAHSLTTPEAALTPQKCQALRQAASAYLGACGDHYAGYDIAFDLAAVEIDGEGRCSVDFIPEAIEYGW